MARILHLTHTDIDSDPRILRAIDAGAKAGHKISAIGITQRSETKESIAAGGNPYIVNVARPKFLRRRKAKTSGWDKESRLEVSEGSTGPVRRIVFMLWLVGRFWKISRKVHPEILHAHDTLVLPIAVLISITSRARVIYDAHELESDKAGSSPLQKKLIFWIEKCSWRWVTGLITVSDAIGDWYFEHFGSPRAVIVLNSPMLSSKVQRQDTNHSVSTVRSDIQAKSDDIICLYLGAFERGRGIERLIEAFSAPAVTARLVLLGDGSIRSEILETTEKLRNVDVLPPVKHDELVDYISDANYGFSLIENVSLSDYLCLPNKMFEYLNAGITLICSNFPEMQRVTAEHRFGYVVDENDEDLMALLATLSKSPPPPKIPRAEIQPFTWEAQQVKLQSLYLSVTESR